jgi:hypothetical protein
MLVFSDNTGTVHIYVKLRRFGETAVVLEINTYYTFRVCVCSLSYPAIKAHTTSLWPLCIYHNFSNYLTNSTIFEIKIENEICFDFSTARSIQVSAPIFQM